MEEKLYTVKDASRIVHYCERRVQQWLKEGKLNGLKVPGGRKWLIPKDALEEFLKGKPRPFLGPLLEGYIVTNSMWDELYDWLIANDYKAYSLKDGDMVFIRGANH